MLKWALVGAGCLSICTIGLVVLDLRSSKPKLDIAEAGALFDRYPHWQRSIAKSQEIALDPALARRYSDRYAAPATLAQDPYMLWQPARREEVTVELGLSRLSQ